MTKITIKARRMTGFGMRAANVVIVAEVSLNARSWSNEAFPCFVGGINAGADAAAQIRKESGGCQNPAAVLL